MELKLYNENYKLIDSSHSSWILTGNVYKDTNNNININAEVTSEDNHIGSVYFESSANSNNVIINISANKAIKDELNSYVNNIIDEVISHLTTIGL